MLHLGFLLFLPDGQGKSTVIVPLCNALACRADEPHELRVSDLDAVDELVHGQLGITHYVCFQTDGITVIDATVGHIEGRESNLSGEHGDIAHQSCTALRVLNVNVRLDAESIMLADGTGIVLGNDALYLGQQGRLLRFGEVLAFWLHGLEGHVTFIYFGLYRATFVIYLGRSKCRHQKHEGKKDVFLHRIVYSV